MRHDIAQMHSEIDEARRQTWDYQVRISKEADPQALQCAIDRVGLKLEPIDPPQPDRPLNRTDRMVEANHVSR